MEKLATHKDQRLDPPMDLNVYYAGVFLGPQNDARNFSGHDLS